MREPSHWKSALGRFLFWKLAALGALICLALAWAVGPVGFGLLGLFLLVILLARLADKM